MEQEAVQNSVTLPTVANDPQPPIQPRIPLAWKLFIAALLILIPISAGAFWAGRQSAQVTNQILTPTPTQMIAQPSPSSPITSTTAPTITSDNNQSACQTVADCYPGPTCNHQVMDQQNGNTSHCPIPECIDGQCLWKPVP